MTFKEKFEKAVHEYIEETNCPMPFIDVERALCAGIIAQIDLANWEEQMEHCPIKEVAE